MYSRTLLLVATAAALAAAVYAVPSRWLQHDPRNGETPSPTAAQGAVTLIASATSDDQAASSVSNTGTWSASTAVQMLVDKGWDEPAARAVIDFYSPLLERLHEESPPDYQDLFRRLGLLAGTEHSLARSRLMQLPELAGLMANAAEIDTKAPSRLATVIRNDPDAPTLIGMFTLAAEARDAIRLCGLIESERQLLLSLAEHDSLDLACWLEPPEVNTSAATAYRHWVGDLLRGSLRDGAGEALDRAALILTIHADAVANLLDTDSTFRDVFATNLVPRFEKLIDGVDDDGFQQQALLVDPRIWTFLHKYPHHAEELIGRVGPLAMDVLLDPRFRDIEPQVIGLFRHADTAVVDGLLDERVRDNPRFIDFLQRPLDDQTRARGLRVLASTPEDAGNLLKYWATLNSNALGEEMADPPTGVATMLPGYATVALLRKAAQGRTVTMSDVGMVGADAAETFLLVKGGGATLKMIAANARNAATKSVGRRTAERVGRETAKEGVELLPWMLEAGHGAVRRAMAEVRDRMVIDATPIVRGMYSRSGVGRDTFRLIDGLDARVFMRQDRRVVIDLAGEHTLGRYLHETAKRAARVVATEDDPTEGLLVETADALMAARQNTAAWWMGTGDGAFTRQLRQKAPR